MKIRTNCILAFVTIISAIPSTFARDVHFDKKVDAGVLQAQLVTAGFKVTYIECSTTRCKITMPDSEKKDPMPEVRKYVYADARELREKRMLTLRTLYDKWEAGTISNEEKDQLIKSTLGIVLGR